MNLLNPHSRVVVTGGAGFLGRYVVEALRKKSCTNIFVPRSHEYDLTQLIDVKALYNTAQPHLVIHLAAKVGGIGANQQNPGSFLYDNLMMGMLLLEKARVYGVKKFVAAATICSYPKNTPVPFKEENLWDGYPEETNAPYGLAKKMLLEMSKAYRKQYNFNSVVLFPVNLYGPGDSFDLKTSHVIPAMIRKIDEAINTGRNEVVLWGDGTPTREFLYVEDCAEAFVTAVECYDSSEPVNLGCGKEIAIGTLAHLLAELMGYRGTFVFDHSRPNGQPRRALDCSRAKELLGWEAQTPLEVGLQKTIDWWRTQS